MAVTKKEFSIDIRMPASEYRRTMYFDKFCLDRTKDGVLMSFGFFADKPSLIDQVSIFMTNLAMERGKHSLVQFLSRLGPIEDEAAPIAIISASKPIATADFIGTSSGQEVHEIVFGVISHNAISGHRVTDIDSKLDMLGVLLLRCQKETLRHFLLTLYAA